ncbi:DUF2931 family protein [Flavobacterium sedimenticola]|uniref:DUF2931 family protein n=1 Tax=Flavobacterium sedimenticola TaxID=3043286 RepID=A0ABT6XT00_9FLAO|nr:DUF2931 family protein [Flavobacterium sedimenticola]MDI9258239.1 DUF2931 family protein [Flavobacterium sedimenticola]
MKYTTLLFFFFVISCKNEVKEREWSAAMSAPYSYRIDGPRVNYYLKGKLINSTSTLTSIGDFGWGHPDSARNSGYGIAFPDSISVAYGGLNDRLQMCHYKGGAKLPVNRIKELFYKGYVCDGKEDNFNYITAGLAPGGRVCVWVDFVEIKRFKVNLVDVYSEEPIIFFGDSLDKLKVNEYLKHHPIDYSIWEKPEKKHDIDFGFTSENESVISSAFWVISNQGARKIIYEQMIKKRERNKSFNFDEVLKKENETNRIILDNESQFMPKELQYVWRYGKDFYQANIILSKDIQGFFLEPYINAETGKSSNYQMIVLGIENDGTHGTVYFEGPGKKEKILSFKAGKYISKEDGDTSEFYYPEIEYLFKKSNG